MKSHLPLLAASIEYNTGNNGAQFPEIKLISNGPDLKSLTKARLIRVLSHCFFEEDNEARKDSVVFTVSRQDSIWKFLPRITEVIAIKSDTCQIHGFITHEKNGKDGPLHESERQFRFTMFYNHMNRKGYLFEVEGYRLCRPCRSCHLCKPADWPCYLDLETCACEDSCSGNSVMLNCAGCCECKPKPDNYCACLNKHCDGTGYFNN